MNSFRGGDVAKLTWDQFFAALETAKGFGTEDVLYKAMVYIFQPILFILNILCSSIQSFNYMMLQKRNRLTECSFIYYRNNDLK